MANRGCTICITVLGGSTGKNEEFSIPVALHAPLSVLKEQLEDITGIAILDQVVILCDLTDVERNNDKLLEGRDYMSLRECGIKNKAQISLHALGMSAEKYAAERKAQMLKVVVEEEPDNLREEDIKRTLATKITAAKADHSYNGVIFDVKCNGPFEVDLQSVLLGGMLGRVRIYARDRAWDAEYGRTSGSNSWAQRGETMTNTGWTLIADQTCKPSWDKPIEIKFDQPVTLLPHTQRGLYCHSSLPDDLGIQYQSYHSKDSIVAQNEHISLMAGLGHTGCKPFDERHGWYRAWRGLSGAVTYRTKWKGWSPLQHRLFPNDLKDAVKTMLLCQNSMIKYGDDASIYNALGLKDIDQSFSLSSCSASASSSSCSPRDSISPSSKIRRIQSAFPNEHLYLNLLPKYIIYNILEYMHWDWFEEVELEGRKQFEEKNEGRLMRRSGIRAAVSENGSEAGLGRSDQQQMLYNLSRIFSGGSSSYAAQAEIMYNNQDDDSSSNEEDDEGYMDTEDAESEDDQGDGPQMLGHGLWEINAGEEKDGGSSEDEWMEMGDDDDENSTEVGGDFEEDYDEESPTSGDIIEDPEVE